MSRLVLYPYPRLSASAVEWTAWSASIDGRAVEIDDIVEIWDADALLSLRVGVRVTKQAADEADVPAADMRLVASISCKDTALTVESEAGFAIDSDEVSAAVEVTVPGCGISEALEVRSRVIAPVPGVAWLSRRVLAECSPRRIPLNSELDGFPTVAFSFASEGLPDGPWRLIVIADDAEATFAHSVRLELNEDYALVRELMEGRTSAFVEAELEASIARVLIGTVSRLLSGSSDPRTPDVIAAEAPDSLAAAAARASRTYLHVSLSSAVAEHRQQPERFEYALAAGVGILRGR